MTALHVLLALCNLVLVFTRTMTKPDIEKCVQAIDYFNTNQKWRHCAGGSVPAFGSLFPQALSAYIRSNSYRCPLRFPVGVRPDALFVALEPDPMFTFKFCKLELTGWS